MFSFPHFRSFSFAPAALLSAALLGAGPAHAQDGPTVKARQSDAQHLLLTIENPAQQRLQLQVLRADRYACLLNQVNHAPSYGSKLNFAGLPAGQYAVCIRVGRERFRYAVQVSALPQTSISIQGLAPTDAPAVVASARP